MRRLGAAQAEAACATSAEGTGYTFGQAYKPGGAWPKITLHSLTRSIDYGNGAMRDEIVLSRAEPLGGGGYPLPASSATTSTSAATSPGTSPAARRARVRASSSIACISSGSRRTACSRRRRATTPRAARRRWRRDVSFADPGRYSATVAGRRRRAGDPGRLGCARSGPGRHQDGDDLLRLPRYRRHQFPMRIRQSMGGYPVLDLAVKEVQLNAPPRR